MTSRGTSYELWARGTNSYDASPHPQPLALPLLPRTLLQVDRGADEAELLTQAALDEAQVARVEQARGEQHEGGRRRGRLGAEQHLGLLAAAHRVRVLGDESAEEGVELAGADPRLPALQRSLQRRHQAVDVPAGAGGHVDP